jgi:hypothetical protein
MSINLCLSIEPAARFGHFANHVSLIEGAHGTLFKNCINSVTAGPSFEKLYESAREEEKNCMRVQEKKRKTV